VRNELLHRVKEGRNILQTIKRRKDNWIGHIMHGNCLLKHITKRKTEGMIKVVRRLASRHTQLLDDSKKGGNDRN
jgi:2-polyprenyl-3-methyl-5-hydroxy-6-metoxy-1,4-benzoquinol methylase